MASCEDDNESSGSIKGVEFIGQLSDYKLLKKNCASLNCT
jgi:hypothetical protein